MKIQINEFADSKFKVEMDMSSKTWVIIIHLIKCLLMSNNSAYEHWKSEIVHFIYDVPKLKGTNKYPTEKQIYKWTYGKRADKVLDPTTMKYEFEGLEEKYNIKILEDYNKLANIIDEMCKGYFSMLAKTLSMFGSIPNKEKELYNYIDDFVTIHSINVK